MFKNVGHRFWRGPPVRSGHATDASGALSVWYQFKPKIWRSVVNQVSAKWSAVYAARAYVYGSTFWNLAYLPYDRPTCKKVQVAQTRLPSVGSRSWSRFLAVSLQVTWVINQAVGCHYFPPIVQLPPQPLRGLLPILLFGEQMHNGCEQFA